MEIVRIYVLPLVLSLGAAVLLGSETLVLQSERARGAPRWMRFGRRASGALLIAAVAFMLHFGGSLPTAGASQETVYRQFHYWVAVLGLVLVAMALAVWDVFDAFRSIRQHVESIEKSEMQRLQEALRRHRDR